MSTTEKVSITVEPDLDFALKVLRVNNIGLGRLLLEILPETEFVPPEVVFKEMAERAKGNIPARITTSHVVSALAQMPDDFVERDSTPGKKHSKTHRKTPAGKLASGAGGHLTLMAQRSGIPTRALIGTFMPVREFHNGQTTTDSHQARLIVLSALSLEASQDWQPIPKLYGRYADLGLGQSAAHNHMSRLENLGLVETRNRNDPNRQYASIHEARIPQTDADYQPVEIIRDYMAVITAAMFAYEPFLQRGNEHMRAFSRNSKLVPFIIEDAL
ncbi:MAG TPA: hypothetical protein VMR18_00295 [Candidatus Saccharimonadales bacterium]|nr:hypothetical protein [Candidatus Saccharimonadales bacterium]